MPYDTFNTYGGAAAMHEDTATTKAAPSEGQSGGSDRKIRFMVMSGFLGAGKTTLIKKLIAQVSGVAVPIGPYEPKAAGKTASNAEESLHKLEQLGLDVSIEDTDRKKKA